MLRYEQGSLLYISGSYSMFKNNWDNFPLSLKAFCIKTKISYWKYSLKAADKFFIIVVKNILSLTHNSIPHTPRSTFTFLTIFIHPFLRISFLVSFPSLSSTAR